MSPLGAISASEGALKWLPSVPVTPGVPSVMSTLPSGENLMTVWPLPGLPSLGAMPTPSVTQTLPSLSTVTPCGRTNILAPNVIATLPDASYLVIGSMFEFSQVLPPQRSNTHRLLPSLSSAKPGVDPKFRPIPCLAQPSSRRYGLGAEFGSLCAKLRVADNAVAAIVAMPS